MIINNKPGAATNIGADYVAHAKADGYTLLTGDTATLTANPALYSKLNYSAEKDLMQVGLLARFPMILVVNSNTPVKNHAEFVAWAKTQKAGVSYATAGAGSRRAIGIASPKRVKNFETIPTLDEQGLKSFEAYAWQGMVAPAGTPADVIAKLNKTLVEALNSTAVKARFQVLGLELIPSTPAQMATCAKSEREKWAVAIRDSGIKLD